jgi:hypothetical protein
MTKNNLIYLNLILVAIFTLLSFVFDQLVINSEDKIREYNFLHKQSYNNYLKSKNLVINLKDGSNRGIFKLEAFEAREDFLWTAVQKVSDKDYATKTYDIEKYKGLHGNLKSIFINRYKSLAYKLLLEAERSKNIFNSFAIRPIEHVKLDLKKKKTLEEMNSRILEYSVEFNANIDLKLIEPYREQTIKNNDIKVIKYEDLLPVRNDFMKAKEIYKKNIEIMLNLNDFYGVIFQFSIRQAREFREIKNSFERKKNFYILFSVLSQILSLFFLIFLFKSLLRIEK